ncbi:TonB-linked outer membrane protein, SusC/RagA family [Mariniphaga anaerophila]|uniref:TonB-linked outer membrane protein, SusC/RagA family n=1 Tax=Mariniphaga anaerophila TaxID=1484053 RepID=A0A1M5BWQ1_9BACT|nr:TonB-dependent receptor [Mariniphaga anaerophila]SHF46846.1 TonB-linked outer membrane protein, SusC/RagA family [Mariniphaga anaerophila]
MANSDKTNQALRWKNPFRYAGILILMQLCFAFTVFSQNITVKGKVIDAASGEELPGVNVVVKGTTTGTVTMADGTYQLEVPANDAVLLFSFIGFKLYEVPVNGNTTINVALEMETTELDEVVAIGYGTVKKRDLTGSVASVNAKQIAAIPVSTAAEAMQGKMAGVQIVSTEGSPDAEIMIRVRGGGSITQSNAPLYIVDGFPVNSINDISPNDIASIDVLKDASSTAIYGARGANGVIIVTTKSGELGKMTANYNGYYGVKQIAKTLDVLGASDYALWQYELALLRSDWTSPDPEEYSRYLGNWQDIDMYQASPGNDWLGITFGNVGETQNHNFSLTGGTEKMKYAFSFNHYDEKSIMYGSDYVRDNFSLKLTNNPNDKVQLDFSVRWSDTEISGSGVNEGGDEKGSSTEGRLRNAMIYSPIPLSGGVTTNDDDTDAAANLYDPITSIKDNDRNRVQQRLNLNGAFNWELVNNMKFRSEVGLDNYTSKDSRFYGLTTYFVKNNTDPLGQPAIIFTNRIRESFRNTNTLQYNFKSLLPESHNMNLLVGQEMLVTKNEALVSEVYGLDKSFDLASAMALNIGTNKQVKNSYSADDKLLSFFGRWNYDYANKYLLSATMRADGSSKFAKGNRWGYFPSASAAWVVSEESFMESSSNWLHFLKFRASYGTAGNNNIPSNQMVQIFESRQTTWVSILDNYWAPSKSMANPDLKWETTVTRNLGLDLAFLGGRLNVTSELYRNTTKDLLIQFLTSGTGYDNQYRNLGKTRNQGVEFSANWIAVEQKKWGLSFNFNIGFNKNKILELGRDNFYDASGWAGSGAGGVYNDYIVAVGGQVGQMWGYLSDGRYEVSDFEGYDEVAGAWILKEGVVDASAVVGDLRPGKMKLKDIGGADGKDGKVTYGDDLDKTIIGNANPLHTGGFAVNANAYGFDVALNFNWSYGNDVYNANKVDYTMTHKYTMRNMLTTMESGSRWTDLDVATGELVNNPEQLAAMNANTTMWSPYVANYVFSDWAVEDGSFLRLNTVTLGYTLPASTLQKVKIQNIRLYCSAYNVFLWTNYSGFDPEVSTRRKTNLTPGVDFSAYPRSSSVVFGLNLTF